MLDKNTFCLTFYSKNYHYKTKNAKHYSMKLLLKNLKLIDKKDKQLHRLGLFVASTYQNKGETDVINLFDAITKNHPNYELSKEEIFAKVWSEKNYNDRAFSVYTSKLNDLVEEFFIQEELKNDPFLKQSLLAKAYARKSNHEMFLKTLKTTEKSIDDKSSDAPQKIASLLLQKVFHPKTKNLEDDTLLEETLKNLELSSIFEQLKLHAELLSRSKIMSNYKEHESLEALLTRAKNSVYQQFVPILIYTNAILLNQSGTVSAFDKTLDLIAEHRKLFNNDEQRQLFSLIQNFNIGQLNKGLISNEQTYKIYQLGLEWGILRNDNTMSETTFLNIANNYSMLKKFDEAEKFIDEYAKQIKQSDTSIVLILAKSNWYFYQFEASRNVHFLHKIKSLTLDIEHISSNILYNLSLKMTRCKAYYELSFFDDKVIELLDNEINRFKSFVQRHKLSKEKVDLYINFLILLSDLIGCIKNKENKKRLHKKAQELDSLGNRNWLLRKIEAM